MSYLQAVCGGALLIGVAPATDGSAADPTRWAVDVAFCVIGGLVCVAVVRRALVLRRLLPPVDDKPYDDLRPELIVVPFAFFLVVNGGVALAIEGRFEEEIVAQLAYVSAAIVAVVIMVVVCARERPGGLPRLFGGRLAPMPNVMLGLGGFLCAVPLCLGAVHLSSWVISVLRPDVDLPPHQVLDMLDGGELPSWAPALLWISAVVVAPAMEELFFRGMVQPALKQAAGRRWALVLTALFFGVVHVSQPHAVLPMILLGLILGWLYERSGGLIAPLIMHMAFNLKTMILFSLG